MGYTKAGMLNYLKQNIPTINILPVMAVQSDDFFSRTDRVIEEVLAFAGKSDLIVRSSSAMEDTLQWSNAGKFTSIPNVAPTYGDIKNAICQVYDSYGTQGGGEILVQPMLRNIKKSGVVFTADMDTFAGYYIVNYSESENSAAVTAGTTDGLKTFIRYKDAQVPIVDHNMRNLLDACAEIEAFLDNQALDIEFAIDETDIVYIFQVRPIAKGNKEEHQTPDISHVLNRIYKKVKKLSAKHPFLLGDTTYFGVMPDWNPAEILGIRPKKLAISLYKELVTDNIWAHQRADYGYRDLTMHPLMVSFCGVPYIDTRITFNSFVPAKLNARIAEKLVNYYLDRLASYPKYHDKIEFEIVFSCYYFGLPKKLKALQRYGFNENEIRRIEFSLLELTNHVIGAGNGLYKQDIQKIEILNENYKKIMNSDLSLVDRIYWLIEECKEYGTLPFAGAARAAFIGVQFLKSFVEIGIISHSEYDAYMKSLDTVTKKMSADLKAFYDGEISREQFLEQYGHIRPGTYDITSKRYDEAADDYFVTSGHQSENEREVLFSFSDAQMERIQLELEQNGLEVTAEELMTFIKESIEGREYLKFVFTKSVSKILQLIEELGKRSGLSKEDMAHLDISLVKQLYTDLYAGDNKAIFEGNIKNNKRQFENAVAVKLPCIIVKPEDVYSFYLLQEEPNFITQKNVTAEVMEMTDAKMDFERKVVFIRAADPGYDFLFTKSIKGLVTQFGGANSHMAIRCAELGIPAIIGAGEKNYQEWSRWKRIFVDCLKKQVIRIE